MKKFLLLLMVIIAGTSSLVAQMGSVYGNVLDKQTGEHLVGANVTVAGTAIGTTTDLDGRYSLRGLKPDTLTIRASMVGYTSTTITRLILTAGQSLKLDVDLQPSTVTTEEVVVTAQRQLATESALLAARKNAATISDGFTMEQIKRTPDATSADALRRVTGLSIIDNKFVFIRGITDRYNGTTLDGASVSTTEAGKKSFSFDQIPSNLLENTMVVKSATPDLPGDFTGGLVQMNTLDFPEHGTYKIAVGTGYNSLTTGKTYATSSGGSKDWLGFDDGSRSFPGYPPGKEIYMSADLTELAQKLPNNFSPRYLHAYPNANLSLSVGDRILFDEENSPGSQLGYIGALSYRTSVQRTEHDINDIDLARYYTGVNNDYSVLWGAIANLSYKFSGLHKISIKNNFDQTATDRVTLSNGYDSPLDSDFRLVYTDWTQRSLYTGQITGEHDLPVLWGMTAKWHASVSSSKRQDPDEKRVVSQRPHLTTDPFQYSTNQRSWSVLNDRTTNYGLDLSLPVGSTKLKAGAQVEYKRTNFQIAYLNIVADYGTPQSFYSLPLDSVYAPENFGRRKWLLQSGSVASDSYEGDQSITGGYLMADLPFELLSQRFRLTGGVRVEAFEQTIAIPRTFGSNPQYLRSTLKKTDALPSVNLTYQISDEANLRFAYSHSINRPEFRERSTTAYFDFVKYELVGGDTSLQRAFIHNYDVRLEYFPGPGELVAISYFRKAISNAIEERLGFSSTRERKPFNSAYATNAGWEIETRKSLGFLGGYFGNFSVSGNYTRVFSDVSYLVVTPQGYVDAVRPMQAQSPYVINLSILFAEPSLGTSLTVAYNKFGERLEAVGFQTEDIYEQPREAVDVAISKPFLDLFEAKFMIRNLTNKGRVLTRRGALYDRIENGTTYSLQVSFSL